MTHSAIQILSLRRVPGGAYVYEAEILIHIPVATWVANGDKIKVAVYDNIRFVIHPATSDQTLVSAISVAPEWWEEIEETLEAYFDAEGDLINAPCHGVWRDDNVLTPNPTSEFFACSWGEALEALHLFPDNITCENGVCRLESDIVRVKRPPITKGE